MKNGARYVVTTHWGTFSLDEGSYQDYLAGKLWICWTPGNKTPVTQTSAGKLPANITEQAIALREKADKHGILNVLRELRVHDTIVPFSSLLSDLSIDEMNLTVRSSNGLKRASIMTFGKLREVLATENGLLNLRNIGQKSVKEIKSLFFVECYQRMLPYEKAKYWQDFLDAKFDDKSEGVLIDEILS